VGRLKDTLKVSGDVAYTCETASYFFLYHVLSRWEKYLSQVNPDDDVAAAEKSVPIDDLVQTLQK
jgi:intron-binding protein aquarius